MKTFPHSDFRNTIYKVVALPGLILLLTIFFPANAQGQSCSLLDSVIVDVCSDTIFEDSCFFRKFNIYFEDTTFVLTDFQVNNLTLLVSFTGDGYIDVQQTIVNQSLGNNFWNKNLLSPTELFISPPFGCQDPDNGDSNYLIDIGDCNAPFLEVVVVAPPGGGLQLDDIQVNAVLNVTSVIDTLCTDICDIAFPSINLSPPPGSGDTCNTDLQVKIQPFSGLGLDTIISHPHQEEKLEVVLCNTGSTAITINDYDMRVIAQDMLGNLPSFGNEDLFLVPTPNSGGDDPYLYEHIGNEHYFFLDEFQFPGQAAGGSQTLAAGETAVLLVYTVIPPELPNEYGLANFDLDFLRLSYQDSTGSYCCVVEVQNPNVVVEFPGDPPCSTDPSVTITIEPGSPFYGDCELYTDVCLEVKDSMGNPDSISIQELQIDLSTLTSGNLYLESISGPGDFTFDIENCQLGLPCPNGGTDCQECTATIYFLNDSSPYMLHDSTCFALTLAGGDGTTFQGIEVIQAFLVEAGDSVQCAPQLNIDETDLDSAVVSCDNCLNYSVFIEEYPGSLDSCQSAFRVYLQTRTGTYNIDSIFVEIDFSNLNDVTFSQTLTQSIACDPVISCGPTIIPPQATVYDTCLYQNGNSFVYEYCPTNPISGTTALFDVVFSGNEGDCISDLMFANTTVIADNSGICTPADVTQAGDDEYCIEGKCISEAMVNGVITLETGEGVKLPVVPASGAFTNSLSDFVSGVLILTNTEESGNGCPFDGSSLTIDGFCDTIVPSACGTGYYSANMECTTDTTYIIQPYHDTFYLNGVTTFDLVQITKHILLLDLLDSDYKKIAADANSDLVISTIDIVELRKLILQIVSELPHNDAWRFVDASHVFPDDPPLSISAFPECIEVNDVNGYSNKNFIGVKIGDVSGDVNPCEVLLPPGDDPATRNLSGAEVVDVGLRYHTVSTHKNDIIEIDFIVQSDEPLPAWQMGLKFDPEYLHLEEAIPSASLPGMIQDNFGLTQSDQGIIRALWFDPQGRDMDYRDGVVAFRLKFKLQKPIDDIMDHVKLDHNVLYSVAYETVGRAVPLKLSDYSRQELSTEIFTPATFGVQVFPNPFQDRLEFFFHGMDSGSGEIIIYDWLGREVTIWSGAITPNEAVIFEPDPSWGMGAFIWKARIGEQTLSGTIIRQ